MIAISWVRGSRRDGLIGGPRFGGLEARVVFDSVGGRWLYAGEVGDEVGCGRPITWSELLLSFLPTTYERCGSDVLRPPAWRASIFWWGLQDSNTARQIRGLEDTSQMASLASCAKLSSVPAIIYFGFPSSFALSRPLLSSSRGCPPSEAATVIATVSPSHAVPRLAGNPNQNVHPASKVFLAESRPPIRPLDASAAAAYIFRTQTWITDFPQGFGNSNKALHCPTGLEDSPTCEHIALTRFGGWSAVMCTHPQLSYDGHDCRSPDGHLTDACPFPKEEATRKCNTGTSSRPSCPVNATFPHVWMPRCHLEDSR